MQSLLERQLTRKRNQPDAYDIWRILHFVAAGTGTGCFSVLAYVAPDATASNILRHREVEKGTLTMDWFSLVPLLVRAIPIVKSIIDVANSNEEIVQKIDKAGEGIADLLQNVGTALFPKVAEPLKKAAGAFAAFDPDVTVWLQNSLNSLFDAGLVPDGVYGPLTRKAVEDAQAKLGLKVDGWAGSLTRTAIDNALSSKPVLGAPKK
jgi:hypothetical protein